jgi:hypothetical protein
LLLLLTVISVPFREVRKLCESPLVGSHTIAIATAVDRACVERGVERPGGSGGVVVGRCSASGPVGAVGWGLGGLEELCLGDEICLVLLLRLQSLEEGGKKK